MYDEGTYKSGKLFKFAGMNKTFLNCDGIDGSITLGIQNQFQIVSP